MERPMSSSLNYSNRPPSSSNMSAHNRAQSISRTAANALASLSSHDAAGSNNGGADGNFTATSISMSSAQSLFLQTLRHLNLDQLYDSPSLSIASLNSDARTRIRTAEWSLYQLFRLYDPIVTTEKLQPFFPPLEPLQSVNLRAALFRCLNELKKDGLLGPRDTILRKSLLDECSGDKFWELCVVFAGMVLRKTVKERIEKEQATSVTFQLATAQTMSKSDRSSMLPLSIAHKKALMRVLAEKQERKSRYQRLAGVLAETEEGLASRKMLAEQRARGGLGRNGNQQTQIAEEVLQTQWTGSEELRDALLDGDEDAAKDSIFTRPFETVWDANENNRLFSFSREDASILEDLEFRTRHQRQRLRKWQTFHDKLAALNPPTGKDVTANTKETPVRFDRHQDLRVDEDIENNPPPTVRQERNINASRYDEVLTAMREELRKNHSMRKASESQQVPPQTRKLSYRNRVNTLDDTPSGNRTREIPSRSPSQTTVPIIRPGMSRRVSSQSRSYHQPKVISQREPIPLKSEVFSPLRSSSQSSASPVSTTHFVTSPAIDDSEASSISDLKFQQSSRNQSDGHGHADSGVGFSMNDNGGYTSGQNMSYNDSGANSPKTVRWSTSSSSQADSGVDLPNRITNHHSNGSISEVRPRGSRPSSLAERTRMSMALSGSHTTPALSPIEDPASPQPESSESDEALNSLVERTRQSMSLAPQPSAHRMSLSTSSSSKHRKSQSAQQHRTYPVNQFETPPRKYSRPPAFVPENHSFPADAGAENQEEEDDTLHAQNDLDNDDENDEQEHEKRALTPRDALFDEDAAYASVFRSRPKIAVSPVLSPTKSAFPLSAATSDAGAGARIIDDDGEEGEEGVQGMGLSSPSPFVR